MNSFKFGKVSYSSTAVPLFGKKLKHENVYPSEWQDALPFDQIPGPKPLPIIGNLWRYLPRIGTYSNMNRFEVLKSFKKQYGDICILKGLGPMKALLVVSCPNMIEKLFRNEGKWPIRETLETYSYYQRVTRKEIFNGAVSIANSQGEEWHTLRKKMNPIVLRPGVLEPYRLNMNEITEEFVKHIRSLAALNPLGEMPDTFVDEINKWSLEIACLTIFNMKTGFFSQVKHKQYEEIEKFLHMVPLLMKMYFKLNKLPSMWKYYNTKDWKTYVQVQDFFTFTVLKYMKEMMANNCKDVEETIFAKMIKADRKSTTCIAVDFLLGGVETTGAVAAAGLYFLGNNHRAQRLLQEELKAILPTKETPLTSEILKDAHYLKAVIKETFRLAPIGIGNMRRTVSNIVLGGYQIPKGVDVFTNNLALCHSNEHFLKAEEFIPERWLPETTGPLSYKKTHPFVYLPFGFGTRTCIGKRIAHTEIEILFAKIFRNFFIEWAYEPLKFKAEILYILTGPLKLRFKDLN